MLGNSDLASVVEHLRITDPNRKIEVVIREGLSADADEGLLSIAFENLLANAWKFRSGLVRRAPPHHGSESENRGRDPRRFIRGRGRGPALDRFREPPRECLEIPIWPRASSTSASRIRIGKSRS